jgi:adenosylcobyric acid synthase
MGLARHADLPTVVVGDIDRGGVFAAFVGTLELLDPDDARLVAGWIVNKFRGDLSLLRPGLVTLAELTERPVLGVIPWLDRVWIDSEDALAFAGWRHEGSGHGLRVAAIRLPRTSNATDLDAIAAEPGVTVTLTADPDLVAGADVVVLPGSRATVDDLTWLRDRGLAAAVIARARAGRPVLGICGGHQMLARMIDDDVESRAGQVPGLDLLPTTVSFGQSKSLRTPTGSWRSHPVHAYEIHHGRVTLVPTDPRAPDAEPFLDGWRLGTVWGTTWHGAFENDGFRRAWLTEAARQAGVSWTPTPGAAAFATLRESMLDRLADAIADHLDTDALLDLILKSP